MADDFINEFRDSFGDEEGPDWIQDLTDEEQEVEEQPGDDLDDFDRLRQQSARASSAYDDLTLEEETGSSGGFSLSAFTPGQRLVLAVLVFLNVVVGAIALLAVTGVIG